MNFLPFVTPFSSLLMLVLVKTKSGAPFTPAMLLLGQRVPPSILIQRLLQTELETRESANAKTVTELDAQLVDLQKQVKDKESHLQACQELCQTRESEIAELLSRIEALEEEALLQAPVAEVDDMVARDVQLDEEDSQPDDIDLETAAEIPQEQENESVSDDSIRKLEEQVRIVKKDLGESNWCH